MKFKSIALLGVGFVAGILLAPKKGKDSYQELKNRVNELYAQVRDLEIDDLKDKVEDIKIEVSKLDYDRSKEIAGDSIVYVKEKLTSLVDYLQNNKEIKPALENAFDRTQQAVVDVISYIDENDLVNKTKDSAKEAYSKSSEYFEVAKDKASETLDKVKDKSSELIEKGKDTADKTLDKFSKDDESDDE